MVFYYSIQPALEVSIEKIEYLRTLRFNWTKIALILRISYIITVWKKKVLICIVHHSRHVQSRHLFPVCSKHTTQINFDGAVCEECTFSRLSNCLLQVNNSLEVFTHTCGASLSNLNFSGRLVDMLGPSVVLSPRAFTRVELSRRIMA